MTSTRIISRKEHFLAIELASSSTDKTVKILMNFGGCEAFRSLDTGLRAIYV